MEQSGLKRRERFISGACPERAGRSTRRGDAAEAAVAAPQSLTAALLLRGQKSGFSGMVTPALVAGLY